MRTLVCCLFAVLTVPASLALAQGRTSPDALPSAAVLETQASASVDAETAGAVDRMVRARLDGLEVVRTSSGVALDLSEVQLALGCVGETAECLAPVADELSVPLLVIPSLDRTDGELTLTIALFDRQAGTIQRVVRQASGERARTDLLDAIDGALRELFGIPLADEPEGPRVTEPAPASGGLSPGSFVLMGAGVVAIGLGVGLGVAFLDAQSEWQSARPNDVPSADTANAAFDRAQAFAISADVFYVAGGLAIAGGLAWLIVDLVGGSNGSSGSSGTSASTGTTVTPIVGPNALGLVARGIWEAP
jgi:hypothetical protein